MKHLAILTFTLGMIAAPLQAHAQKPVEFNGMVFDPPPTQGYGYEAPQAPDGGTHNSIQDVEPSASAPPSRPYVVVTTQASARFAGGVTAPAALPSLSCGARVGRGCGGDTTNASALDTTFAPPLE